MDSDRLTLLERRLAQVETELATAEQLIEELQQGASRSRGLGRLISTLAACGLIAIGAVTAGTAAAAPGPQTLTVKAPFVVQNDVGKVLFKVSNSNGAGFVSVYDHTGNSEIALEPNMNGGMLLGLYSGKTRQAGIGGSATGGILQVNNTEGKPMAIVNSSGETGIVSLFGSDSHLRALLSSTTDTHGGSLVLYGTAGDSRVALHATAAAGALTILNEAGTARVQAGVLAGDKGVVRTYGPKGFDYISGR